MFQIARDAVEAKVAAGVEVEDDDDPIEIGRRARVVPHQNAVNGHAHNRPRNSRFIARV
jgi:hypothetical protein